MPNIPDLQHYYGDIAISIPRARAQAMTRGHEYHDEVQLLVVHGVLHLLGHDHASPEERDEMWSVQAKILTKIGVSSQIAD
jgi:probable rRNA maturation factor